MMRERKSVDEWGIGYVNSKTRHPNSLTCLHMSFTDSDEIKQTFDARVAQGGQDKPN